MQPKTSEYVALIATEIAWLLGSWAIAFVALGVLVGFNRLLAGPLDIQLHNTYFRLSTGYAVFPLFVFVATVVTVVRGVIGRFRQGSSNAVLALLGLVWLLLLIVFFALLKNF